MCSKESVLLHDGLRFCGEHRCGLFYESTIKAINPHPHYVSHTSPAQIRSAQYTPRPKPPQPTKNSVTCCPHPRTPPPPRPPFAACAGPDAPVCGYGRHGQNERHHSRSHLMLNARVRTLLPLLVLQKLRYHSMMMMMTPAQSRPPSQPASASSRHRRPILRSGKSLAAVHETGFGAYSVHWQDVHRRELRSCWNANPVAHYEIGWERSEGSRGRTFRVSGRCRGRRRPLRFLRSGLMRGGRRGYGPGGGVWRGCRIF